MMKIAAHLDAMPQDAPLPVQALLPAMGSDLVLARVQQQLVKMSVQVEALREQVAGESGACSMLWSLRRVPMA